MPKLISNWSVKLTIGISALSKVAVLTTNCVNYFIEYVNNNANIWLHGIKVHRQHHVCISVHFFATYYIDMLQAHIFKYVEKCETPWDKSMT